MSFSWRFLMKATLPEGAWTSRIKIIWILLLSSEFKSHLFSLPNLLLVSPQECFIHFQLHLDNIEVSAVLCDFHSPDLCVLSQTCRIFQSLVFPCIVVAGEIDCTNTDTANSGVHPWIPRTDRACTKASCKYSVKKQIILCHSHSSWHCRGFG